MTDDTLRFLYQTEIESKVSALGVEAFFSFKRNNSDGTYVNQNDEAAFQAWKVANNYD